MREPSVTKLDEQIDACVQSLCTQGQVIAPIQAAPWIADLETRLGYSLPVAYRSLVTRYTFEPLELSRVELIANRGDGAERDLAVSIFRDAALSSWLLRNGYLQIGNPCLGNYDPVCLNLGRQRSNREPAVVTLDHEAILLGCGKVRVTPLAGNFVALLTVAA
jgi:hypothetical protein